MTTQDEAASASLWRTRFDVCSSFGDSGERVRADHSSRLYRPLVRDQPRQERVKDAESYSPDAVLANSQNRSKSRFRPCGKGEHLLAPGLWSC